jgi:hypothetical protein
MKRVITTSVVAGLLGALGYVPVASAEGTLYGSVRSGIVVADDGVSDAMWDIGAYDGYTDHASSDRLFSRIGVKASHELDNGTMAGLHIEKRLDNFRTRHQNVWLEGGMGRVTLGQQSTPYQGATSWDGTNFTGGTGQPLGSRASGVSFSSDLGGPFNFKAMVMDDNSAGDGYGEGADQYELSGSLAAGGVNINVGYASNDTNSHMGATVGGAFGALGWEVGFETDDPEDGSEDTTRAGFFADYSIGSGAFYFYMADQSGATDNSTWTTGYSHGLGSGVKVIAEHRDRDSDGTLSILAVVVGF